MASLLFVTLIALSGLVLNHADALGLSTRHAAGPTVLRIYGIDPPPIDTAYEAGGILFAIAAGTLYADGGELATEVKDLRGVVVSNDQIVIATSNEFLLTTTDAVVIERLAPNSPGTLTRLGTDGKHVVAAIENKFFEFDVQRMSLLDIGSVAVDNIRWSEPVTPGSNQVRAIARAALGQSLSWERILGDLHSGRILPTVGRYVADFTALCLLYLCASGVVLWFRRR